MSSVQGVRVSTGAVISVVATTASWLLLRLVRSLGADYPVISWVGLVPLVAVALLVLVMAWQIRSYLHGKGALRPSPQRGRGTLVGAQAAALGGAALVGWYAANALVHLPNADVVSERSQLVWALIHLAAALGVSVSGYVGQSWCRIPSGEHDDGEDDALDEGDLAYG